MANGETDMEKRIRAIETVCSAQLAVYKTTVEKVKDHEERMRDIEDLVPALRAVMWASTVFVGSMVVFIWSLITGQVQIVIP